MSIMGPDLHPDTVEHVKELHEHLRTTPPWSYDAVAFFKRLVHIRNKQPPSYFIWEAGIAAATLASCWLFAVFLSWLSSPPARNEFENWGEHVHDPNHPRTAKPRRTSAGPLRR